MKALRTIAVSLAMTALAAPAAMADVELKIHDGRVTLTAKDATLRQILGEWARVGQTTIVNLDRVPGGPVTLQFTDMPEDQALETLLRSLTGYIAAPRANPTANLSTFDRILVMPSVAPAAAPVVNNAPPPAALPQPATPAEFSGPAARTGVPIYPYGVPAAPRAQREGTPPAYTPQVQPPPAYVPPAQAPAPAPAHGAAYPGAPTTPAPGVSVPGTVAAPSQQPGQTATPQQQRKPARPPGG